MYLIIINQMAFVLHRWQPHVRRGIPIIKLSEGDFFHVALMCRFLILTIWESVCNEETMVGCRKPSLNKNLCLITPGNSLVNKAPPMPLRASSHPGCPKCPSCSALACYSCWLGFSPLGGSGDQTPVTHMAAPILYHYRFDYATQPTIYIFIFFNTKMVSETEILPHVGDKHGAYWSITLVTIIATLHWASCGPGTGLQDAQRRVTIIVTTITPEYSRPGFLLSFIKSYRTFFYLSYMFWHHISCNLCYWRVMAR